MKQKLIIGFSLLLLFAALIFMAKDLFWGNGPVQKNPYEYDLIELKKVDADLVCYDEVAQIRPDIDKLKGIAIDAKDRIYITGKDKVIIYDMNGNLQSVIDIGTNASCITISPSGIIFLGVSDHIEEWETTGVLIKKWESPNNLTIITSIAVTEKDVFVADAGNKIVHRYNLAGDFVNEIGRKDTSKNIPGFFIPSPYFDLAIGREGELWVVNPGRHQLEAYKENGELISSWERTSMQLDGFSGCCNPSHIAILADGSFVTSEKGLERVKIHLPSGDFKCVVATPEQFDEETRGLDLAVDSKNRILVLDPKKMLVRIFIEKDD